MFYSKTLFLKRGALAKLWLAAHWQRKLNKSTVQATDINLAANSIENSEIPLALRVSGQLLLGLVRIYDRKVRYLQEDCQETYSKLRTLWSKPASSKERSSVDLAPEQLTSSNLTMGAAYDSTNMPDQLEDLFGSSAQGLITILQEQQELFEPLEEESAGHTLSYSVKQPHTANKADISLSQQSLEEMRAGEMEEELIEPLSFDGEDDVLQVEIEGELPQHLHQQLDEELELLESEASAGRRGKKAKLGEEQRSPALEMARDAVEESINLSLLDESQATALTAQQLSARKSLLNSVISEELPLEDQEIWAESKQPVEENRREKKRTVREARGEPKAAQQRQRSARRAGVSVERDSLVELADSEMKESIYNPLRSAINRLADCTSLITANNIAQKRRQLLQDNNYLNSIFHRPATANFLQDPLLSLVAKPIPAALGQWNNEISSLFNSRFTTSYLDLPPSHDGGEENQEVSGELAAEQVAEEFVDAELLATEEFGELAMEEEGNILIEEEKLGAEVSEGEEKDDTASLSQDSVDTRHLHSSARNFFNENKENAAEEANQTAKLNENHLSQRSKQFLGILKKQFNQSKRDVLEFNEILPQDNRNKILAAQVFYQLLVLSNLEAIEPRQQAAYGDILVHKADKFNSLTKRNAAAA
jgi:hypothetical protein